ncbi:hypothetical protein A2Y85_05590 [candidate division WOR-3 bacterium RBG_13_43_14]|uniref:Alpha-2-macroglobulin domain-containing protein n=1 Tax=candidate division WOR-3 bacterium RBG_13_43_14 TaxID=1802590 RepID=A0A1F4UF61_UNCW3|nr:MAG: hypothetical protein A2Y85_05590 [candidate division WOR-3 bacterium RBG_13_43_14]
MKAVVSSVILSIILVTVLGFALIGGAGKNIELSIPINDMKGKVGKCVIEVITPDDHVIGSSYRFAYINSDYYQLPIKVSVKDKVEDYDLLRVKVVFKNETRIYSLFQLQDRMIVKILGQDDFIKGTTIKYQVIVRNQKTDEPLDRASVKVTLINEKSEDVVFNGVTDRSGSCPVQFDLPEDLDRAELRFDISSDIGSDQHQASINLRTGNLTYLVTDKPIYQPGQTIHLRTLSLKKPDLEPVKGREIVLEVEDSKGNKIFKKTIKTDDYGTAYAQLSLADEINFGNYTVRALLGPEKVEKTVKVEKYVLPKFKPVLTTNKEYYLPGETLEGDLDVQYFFGKPVVNSKVIITIYRYDIGFQREAELSGKTDNSGRYHFTGKLPEYFVGEPLEKGDAFIRLDIEVTDQANHSEKISIKKKIVQDLITISIVPEGGNFRANLDNRFYVLANYPDGSPCKANIEVNIDGKKISSETDDFGIAEFYYRPVKSEITLSIKAKDDKGESSSLEKSFSLDVDRDQIIMRMPRGIYKVGESVDIGFLTTRQTGRVYIDIVKDNQTMLIRSVEISKGLGNYRLNLTPDLDGSIWIHAYIVTPGSDIVRDTRFCYIHSADDLVINVKGDKDEYLPGGDANVVFTVKGNDGKPRVAALCVAIVDEAVFAVSELQPGLEKVYFTLEKELLEPRYEIHGFEPEAIVLKKGIQARAENIMFSTLVPKEPFAVNYTTPQDVDSKIIQAFSSRLTETRDNIYAAINKYYAVHNKYPKAAGGLETLIDEGFLRFSEIMDPWSRQYRITTSENELSWFNIASAGPDGIFDNEDDITEWGWGGRWDQEVMFEADGIMAPRAVAGATAERPMIAAKSAAPPPRDKKADGGPDEPRVREFFPETFVFEPALITDASGVARLAVTMPDAITTWRVTSFASSAHGELGSNLSSILVFQEFFVDIDLPVALTEGDEISIPIAIYNYLPRDQKVRIELQSEDWFEIKGNQEITRNLKKDEVSVVYFPIMVDKIGYHQILVKAYGEAKSDAIKRSIAVLPNGKRFDDIVSDRLKDRVSHKINFPANAIPDGNQLMFKLYPGIYSQVVDGLDKLFQMPFGCFEQTSSVTYPNILLLNYLRQSEQIKPETEMSAEQYISLGYQRLLSFEVTGGGFSWFGDAPANKILTAYGLMEFNDMSKVYEIDERVIERTAQWLKNQQEKDGSWSPDKQYLHQESWGRIQNNQLMPTAYICWALGETGDRSQAVTKGIDYLFKNLKAANDPYILALVANAFVAVEPKGAQTMEVLKKLVDMAKIDKDVMYWESDIPSITFSRGKGADIEATGLAVYALIKAGKYPDVVSKVLTYLIQSKDPSGLWYTTQGTVIALRSMVAALGGTVEDVEGQVIVIFNGKTVEDIKIDKSNADLMHQIDLTPYLGKDNVVEITLKGEGNFLYELTRSYYIPWKDLPRPEKPPFTIDVNYDRKQLVVNDIVNVDVSIRLNRAGTAQMVMIDLGIPPGFEVQTPTLDEYVGKKIQKYSMTTRQLIIYLDEVSSQKPVELSYSLKAKYPIKAQVRSSRVYEYYNTDDEGIEEPFEMKVSL